MLKAELSLQAISSPSLSSTTPSGTNPSLRLSDNTKLFNHGENSNSTLQVVAVGQPKRLDKTRQRSNVVARVQTQGETRTTRGRLKVEGMHDNKQDDPTAGGADRLSSPGVSTGAQAALSHSSTECVFLKCDHLGPQTGKCQSNDRQPNMHHIIDEELSRGITTCQRGRAYKNSRARVGSQLEQARTDESIPEAYKQSTTLMLAFCIRNHQNNTLGDPEPGEHFASSLKKQGKCEKVHVYDLALCDGMHVVNATIAMLLWATLSLFGLVVAAKKNITSDIDWDGQGWVGTDRWSLTAPSPTRGPFGRGLVSNTVGSDARLDVDTLPSQGSERGGRVRRQSPYRSFGDRVNYLTSAEKLALLQKHNELRGRVQPYASNMEEMVWDEKLAISSQQWADQCIWEHGPSWLLPLIGQNLAVHTRLDKPLVELVQMWYDEHHDFTYPSYCRGPMCTHYTQMAWATTTRMGCAITLCDTIDVWGDRWPRTLYLACNYTPKWLDELMAAKGVAKCMCLRTGFAPPNFYRSTMVWATTTKVGCAIRLCETMQVWGEEWPKTLYLVCDYSSKGNWIGYAPYKRGRPCSQCPPKYGGRCANNLCTMQGTLEDYGIVMDPEDEEEFNTIETYNGDKRLDPNDRRQETQMTTTTPVPTTTPTTTTTPEPTTTTTTTTPEPTTTTTTTTTPEPTTVPEPTTTIAPLTTAKPTTAQPTEAAVNDRRVGQVSEGGSEEEGDEFAGEKVAETSYRRSNYVTPRTKLSTEPETMEVSSDEYLVRKATCRTKMSECRDEPCIRFRCPANCGYIGDEVIGTLWYDARTSICQAGVHYGAVTNSGGLVDVSSKDQIPFFTGSYRSGITSIGTLTPARAFMISRVGVMQADCRTTVDQYCPYRGRPIHCPRFYCPPSCASYQYARVYGTGTYTDNSSICRAAIHAGVLQDYEAGYVDIWARKGRTSYHGSNQNGVISESYGYETGSAFEVFKVE
ncbi:cysteine-rich secretory protein LCCL [Branchiostoma belcheri]|nr:cysteine-rich secretory protein LCCL [Branchiostoma belcheri]